MLLLLAGASDLARAYFVGIQVADGARQAALYAADNPGTPASDLMSIAEGNTGSSGSSLAATVLDCPSGRLSVDAPAPTQAPNASGFLYQPITVTCSLPLLTPLLPSPVTIGASATGLVQIGVLTILTPSPLPTGIAGQSYSTTLSASGGVPPYTWGVSAGALPTGLTLNPTSGTITGTPTTDGSSTFTVTVTDSATPSPQTDSATFTLTIGTLDITTSALPGASQGQAYSTTLAATGGTTPYTWSLAGGSLPPGLTLSSGGVISGTESGTSSNANYTFTAQVTDSTTPTAESATQTFTITVSPNPLTITTTSLPSGKKSKAYTDTLQATGGTTPYSWSLASGSLPPGLTLSSSGVIGGTLTSTTGTYTVTVQALDSTPGTPEIATSGSLTITVSP